jgi:phosphatidate cytidylyltransferase
MLTRILSGIVMGVGVLSVLMYLPWWAFGILVALIAAIASDEFQRMASPERSASRRMVLNFISAMLSVSPIGVQYGIPLEGLWVTSFLIIAISHLLRPLPLEGSAQRVSIDALGVLYIGVTLPALLSLRLLDIQQGWGWVLLTMLITFGGDTGGYFAGRALGGRLFGARRLAPQLSPKKTIEGYIGGLILGTAGAWASITLFDVCATLTLADCMWMGLIGVTLGVAGDLFESMMKRSAGVKDSGALIPGHGGVLDRVDALMFVAPFIFMYLTVLKPMLSP